MTSSKK